MNILSRVYWVVGVLSLVTGFIGIFLPVLPTTPFVILSAFCFSKSSPKLHQWLLDHKVFGPSLRDWEKHKVIRPRAKALALVMMTGGMIYPIFFMPHLPIVGKISMGVTWFSVGLYILTRNSQPPQSID